MLKKILLYGGIAVIALFVIAQIIPYGHDHTNPPVVSEPAWDSPQTRALAQRACFDCHSNEVIWPVYSNVAPASWLVARDVEEGRSYLNFSDWGATRGELDDVPRVVQSGEMPPAQYLLIHKTARLTADEKLQLAQGLAKTLGVPLSGGESEREN